MSGVLILWALALVMYGLANALFLGEIWIRKKQIGSAANVFAFCGMAVQLAALILVGLKFKVFPILNLHDALGSFAILCLAAYFAALVRWPVRGIGFFAASLAFLATLASYAYPTSLPAPSGELSGLTLQVHIAIIILSFGVFALAFCAALAYLVQDAILRGKHNIQLARKLPPLNVLDSMINRFVGLGFILLSIGMALGSVWADRWWGSWWSFDPKQDLALVTWIVYAIYIHARTLSGSKGRKLVLFIVFGFLLVVITFVGANLIPGRHNFA